MPLQPPWQLDDCGWVANRWCELLPLPVAAQAAPDGTGQPAGAAGAGQRRADPHRHCLKAPPQRGAYSAPAAAASSAQVDRQPAPARHPRSTAAPPSISGSVPWSWRCAAWDAASARSSRRRPAAPRKLLARAQTGVADRNLLLGLAGQADQHARQIHDLHRLAHVQHEDLAGLAHQRRPAAPAARPPGSS